MVAYHRPDRLDDALALLARPARVALGGGTVLNADREPSDLEAVDLQALGLSGIEADGDRLRLGATTTLDEIARHELVPATMASVARAEEPSTLRTLATIGGAVAVAGADSVLVAALLAHGAEIELAGAADRSLVDLLAGGVPPGAIVTAVILDASGEASVAVTGRTPRDVPIVAAYGRRSHGTTTIAVTGVADHPVVVDPSDPVAGIEPRGDFRGSTEYRRELAGVLVGRVIEELG